MGLVCGLHVFEMDDRVYIGQLLKAMQTANAGFLVPASPDFDYTCRS
jgi:hypothetical protein